MKNILSAAVVCLALVAPASAFEFTFDWGSIPLCTSGNPNRVDNPTFTLSGVPAGTAAIKFILTDLDVSSFTHGGGTVPYAGDTVAPGAFKYLSPCPPNGSHTYSWAAQAIDAAGAKLAVAKSKQSYP